MLLKRILGVSRSKKVILLHFSGSGISTQPRQLLAITCHPPKRDNAFVRALLLPLPNYTQTRNSLYKSICPFPSQVLVKLKSLYKKLYKTLNWALSYQFAKPPAFAYYPILPLRVALLGISLNI